MSLGITISLTAYFLLMIGIGIYAWRKSTSNSEEYLLGGRQLSPGVAALSAGASDMSGWLLMGLPGALFVSGLTQSWIGIGLVVGAFFNWVIVAPRLREQTERYDNSLTIPEFLSKRFPSKALSLRSISAIVIVIFFSVYTASGLVAGGKLFDTAFPDLIHIGGMSAYQTGIYLTLGIVLIYTMVGGFLAVSLTDFIQGCIMMLALVIMPIVVLIKAGGFGVSEARMMSVDPNFLSMFHGLTVIGFLSAVAWGLGYFGQPHIIVRFMAVRSVKDVPAARNIGMAWMIISLAGAVGVGIFGRSYTVGNDINVPRSRNDLHHSRQPALYSADHRLPAGRAAGGGDEHDFESASGGIVLADGGFLSAVPAPQCQRTGNCQCRPVVRLGGGDRRCPHRPQSRFGSARSRLPRLGRLRRGLRPADHPVADMARHVGRGRGGWPCGRCCDRHPLDFPWSRPELHGRSRHL